LEERLADVFTHRLREMDAQSKAGLAGALKTASDPALVRSAFDLPAEQRATIQNALNETFSAEIHIRFETAPDLISGIELTTNGQKVAWSISDYLASLEKGVDELLKERDKPETEATTSTDLTQQITNRAYELYEQRGHKSDSAIRDWSQAEREIRNTAAKTEPKSETKPEPKPEAKAEPKPETKAEPKPETKAEPKPEAKAEPKPETKAEPKPEVKTEPKPEKPKP
jgi:F-type H+-transporting ATPase subunit b